MTRIVGLAELKNKHSYSVEFLQSQLGVSCFPVSKVKFIHSLILAQAKIKRLSIYSHKNTVVHSRVLEWNMNKSLENQSLITNFFP